MTDDQSGTRTFPLSGPITLDCRLRFGSVTVHAQDDRGDASVTLRQRDTGSEVAAATTVELRGHTLVVHAPKPRGTIFDRPLLGGRYQQREAVDIDITIPSGTAVKIVAGDADVALVMRISPRGACPRTWPRSTAICGCGTAAELPASGG
jgi:hypothetical protein